MLQSIRAGLLLAGASPRRTRAQVLGLLAHLIARSTLPEDPHGEAAER